MCDDYLYDCFGIIQKIIGSWKWAVDSLVGAENFPPDRTARTVIPAQETVQETQRSSFLRKQEPSKIAKLARVFYM